MPNSDGFCVCLKSHIFEHHFSSYTIVVAEQDAGDPFNRAKLFNVGYQELKVRMHSNILAKLFWFCEGWTFLMTVILSTLNDLQWTIELFLPMIILVIASFVKLRIRQIWY